MLDYFQGVVTEYLVADRAAYVNTELLIQLDEKSPLKGRHWYCDAAAISFREKKMYLCEVTYSKSMSALSNRLLAWSIHWGELVAALKRDCRIPDDWQIEPWVFIPEKYSPALKRKIISLADDHNSINGMPYPRIIFLEDVMPWKYVTWDRKSVRFEGEGD